jgi:hypothetical protein
MPTNNATPLAGPAVPDRPLDDTYTFFETLVYSMLATRSTTGFDELSFARYMEDIGREYRNQALELISICRSLAQAKNQTRSSYDELRRYYSHIMPILGPVQLF